jgi:hypothetical protein
MVGASVTSGAFALVSVGLVVVLGIGGAWLAVAIDRGVSGRSRSVTPA